MGDPFPALGFSRTSYASTPSFTGLLATPPWRPWASSTLPRLILGERATALLEVCLMVLLVAFAAWLFEAYLSWFALRAWCFKALWVPMILLAIVLPKRDFGAYGFSPENPRFTLKWSLVFVAVFILPAAASIALSEALGAARQAELSPLGIVSETVFLMIFVGLIEEAYFRGYAQSRLNEVFEKRWRRLVFKAWKVNYGVSLPLTSVIFALLHVVNYWNPITSRWEPTWWMPVHILGCFAFGCVAGALREASGDVYVPASLHGGAMTAYTFLSIYANELALNVGLFISWFFFFLSLARFFQEAERLKRPAASPGPSAITRWY
ncbi:MAG: CPBP family intramembrane glutamic endopeptidase [Fervidicoccaceae archaeon]